jgi:F-type H+-transporting ATPase subunit epsilon
MADEILLEIVTPEKMVFSGMVEQVTIPGSEGQFGVLKGHTPLLSFVDIGELNLIKEGKRHYYAINTGYAEVASNKVTLLVETAEPADAIDKERAHKAMERAQAELSKLPPGSTEDYDKLKAALMRAIARINAANRG